MPTRSPPPAESDLLCESCGYILNGLANSPATHCPECGYALAASTEPGHRHPAPIEIAGTRGFWPTTWQVLFRKRRFFRETLSRPTSAGTDMLRVVRFGRTHRGSAGVLFGAAAAFHLAWMAETRMIVVRWDGSSIVRLVVIGLFLIGLSVLMLEWVTRLAVRLTTTESRWWGMRLPEPVVRRALDFHAANYLPVGILALVLTAGFRIAMIAGWLDALVGVPYLIVLSVAVVVGAIWLFESFVIAMRRVRYANL